MLLRTILCNLLMLIYISISKYIHNHIHFFYWICIFINIYTVTIELTTLQFMRECFVFNAHISIHFSFLNIERVPTPDMYVWILTFAEQISESLLCKLYLLSNFINIWRESKILKLFFFFVFFWIKEKTNFHFCTVEENIYWTK